MRAWPGKLPLIIRRHTVTIESGGRKKKGKKKKKKLSQPATKKRAPNSVDRIEGSQ